MIGQYSRMMSEIIDVPLPRAASRRLISFLTFQISIFFSASFAWASLMLAAVDTSSAGCLEVEVSLRAMQCKLDSAEEGQDC